MRRRESAEGPRRFLQLEELRLARDRQPRERGARGYRTRIDTGQNSRVRRRVRFRQRDAHRKRRELRPLAKLRVACLERVEMLSHVKSAEKSLWIDREKSVASRPGREASRSEARDST